METLHVTKRVQGKATPSCTCRLTGSQSLVLLQRRRYVVVDDEQSQARILNPLIDGPNILLRTSTGDLVMIDKSELHTCSCGQLKFHGEFRSNRAIA